MARPYMIPRGIESRLNRFGRRIYCVSELYNCVRCFVIKSYRRVYITTTDGKPIPILDGLTEQLRFLKIPQLKLDCQLVAQGYDDDLERRRQESFHFASGQRKLTDKATIFVNDVITFDKEPYTYRRAMMDRWIQDSEIIRRNPILFTGYTLEDARYWCDWAVENGKDGIYINFKEAPYTYQASDVYLVFRSKK